MKIVSSSNDEWNSAVAQVEPPPPTLQVSVGVIVTVAALIFVSTVIVGAPIELSMFIAMLFMMLVLLLRGFSVPKIQDFAFTAMKSVLELIIILITVGMLIGTWAQSGTIPYIITLGLDSIHPSFFYPIAILLCSVTSLATGTSWGTMGSVGVALMAVGSGLGMPPAITAGAVVSGAYFGDKLSLLSDSTNLMAALTKTPIMEHIKYMMITTGPAYICTLIVFGLIGWFQPHNNGSQDAVADIIQGLEGSFTLNWTVFIPAVVLLAMLFFRLPPYMAIFGGVLSGGIIAVAVQGATINEVVTVMSSGFELTTGVEGIDSLVSGGGMLSMAGLAMLFLFAVGTSGLLQSGGFVDSLLEAFLRQANTQRKLMVLTSPLMIITVGLGAALSFAAVLLGTLLSPAYKKMGLQSKNLSRTMEDSGTTYDAFWPWGGGGVFAAGALGVATLDYMPFMFFAFFSTAFGIIVALTQFKVATIPGQEDESKLTEESEDPSDGAYRETTAGTDADGQTPRKEQTPSKTIDEPDRSDVEVAAAGSSSKTY